MDDKERITQLEEKITQLEEELLATKTHLKKYTAPSRREYYEKNKDIIKERNRKYKETTNYKSTPEQRKEYNKQAYLKRKEKLQNKIDKKHENI